ncbi:hypothetical protein C7H84_08105 [Burkholderia sp. Nafp2/4-1b]|nr:hypothetical protein C7H84_08105 [Burkholderia sp. Nafp2/4-1b]
MPVSCRRCRGPCCSARFLSPATSRSLLPVDSIRNRRRSRGARLPLFLIGNKILDLRIVKPITNSEINVNPSHRLGNGITI